MLTAWLRLAYCRDHNGNLRDISARFPRDACKCSGINRPNGRGRAACFTGEQRLPKKRRINHSSRSLESVETSTNFEKWGSLTETALQYFFQEIGYSFFFVLIINATSVNYNGCKLIDRN